MAACYHPTRFSDPVFTDLRGERRRHIEDAHRPRRRPHRRGSPTSAPTTPRAAPTGRPLRTFSATGRRVHNVIDATFAFRDNKIVEHTDVFDFWRWSGQALGPDGKLLGWTPSCATKVRAQAARGLDAFLARRQQHL